MLTSKAVKLKMRFCDSGGGLSLLHQGDGSATFREETFQNMRLTLSLIHGPLPAAALRHPGVHSEC